MKLLNDQNSKVSVSAASTFSGLIETLRVIAGSALFLSLRRARWGVIGQG